MSVAIATSQAFQAPVFMTARNGRTVDEGVDTTSVASTASGSPSNLASGSRYPVIGFKYDQEASRLVLLYRNPDTGATVAQIPTEVALRQYEEQQQKDRKADQRQLLHIVEDGGVSGTAKGTTAIPGAPVKTTAAAKTPTLTLVSSTPAPAVSADATSAPPSPMPSTGVNIVV